MPGGAAVCSGHRFLCLVVPHSSRPRLSNPTRLRPVSVQLRSIFVSNADTKLFGSKLSLIPRAVDSSTAQPSVVSDDDFSVSKVSFGVVGLGVGLSLLSMQNSSQSHASHIQMLKACRKNVQLQFLNRFREVVGDFFKSSGSNGNGRRKLTTLLQLPPSMITKHTLPLTKHLVKSDVTRYRYGDEQHLDEALKRIFQYGQGGGIPRRSAPVLQLIREEVTQDGKYCLVLVFEAKTLQLSDFEKRQAKFASFFGPGIIAEIGKGEKDLYEVRLISDTDPNALPS